MDRHATVVVEHGDELEACTEGIEVLAQCRHAYVVGVLELGDRSLGDVETVPRPNSSSSWPWTTSVATQISETTDFPDPGEWVLPGGVHANNRSTFKLCRPVLVLRQCRGELVG